MDPNLLKKLNAERRARRAAILVTDQGDGRDRLVLEGDVVVGALGNALERAFQSGRSSTIEADERSYFLNVHLPPARLIVIGAVHISQALAPIASLSGFDMTLIDPRTAFATPERFDNVTLIAEWPDDALKQVPLDAYSAVAALTHDPKIDDDPLYAALKANCFYVGALGSRKTHAKRVDRLLERGLALEEIKRISAPIGLDIGASSPAEIAVAIMAEIIASLRKRSTAAP